MGEAGLFDFPVQVQVKQYTDGEEEGSYISDRSRKVTILIVCFVDAVIYHELDTEIRGKTDPTLGHSIQK